MTKEDSILLDLLRFLAAILVLIHHAEQLLDANYLSVFASFGHDAVIFFFILSGFVISYITDKEKNSYDYIISRAARMYSVVIPSLILVICLYFVGDYFFEANYSQRFRDVNWYYIVFISLSFLNQTSITEVYVPTNGPFWSISYEVWYYILFGSYFFLNGFKKWLVTILLSIIAGVKILLLFPTWILGYYLYKYRNRICNNYIVGAIFVLTSMLMYLYLRYLNLDDSIVIISNNYIFGNDEVANNTLSYSKRFVSDYIISILFVALLVGLFMLNNVYSNLLNRNANIIRKAASTTFSIYLYHYPLLVFFDNIFRSSEIVILACLVSTICLARVTENKKYLLKSKIEVLYSRLSLLRALW